MLAISEEVKQLSQDILLETMAVTNPVRFINYLEVCAPNAEFRKVQIWQQL